nr:MAG TPA: hypothetical protein [Caudoviricetes sp.]
MTLSVQLCETIVPLSTSFLIENGSQQKSSP